MARHRESTELAGFLRRMTRALVRRAESGDLEALVALRDAHRDTADAMVLAARSLNTQGVTWADIGGALGTTKQAAQKRFGE